MHEVNCRVLQDDGLRVTLDLHRRHEPVTLRKGWITLRPRNPDEYFNWRGFPKYPHTVTMQLALAQCKGIVPADQSEV